MALDTYTGLKAEIALWMHRSNLTDVIPSFIALAESRMNKVLRVREMLSEEELAATSGSPDVALPSGFLQLRSIRTDSTQSGSALTARPIAAVRDLAATSGTPKFFAYADTGLIVYPTPSDDMALYAECFVAPDALSGSVATNAILTKYPELYLQGALIEGYRYIRQPEAQAVAQAAFDQAVAEANKASRKLMASGASAPQTTFKRNIP